MLLTLIISLKVIDIETKTETTIGNAEAIYWSNDSSKIATISYYDSLSHINIYNIDGGAPVSFPVDVSVFDKLDWSPDDTKLCTLIVIKFTSLILRVPQLRFYMETQFIVQSILISLRTGNRIVFSGWIVPATIFSLKIL